MDLPLSSYEFLHPNRGRFVTIRKWRAWVRATNKYDQKLDVKLSRRNRNTFQWHRFYEEWKYWSIMGHNQKTERGPFPMKKLRKDEEQRSRSR